MSTVDDRLSALEMEVSILRQQVSTGSQNGNWLDQVAGSFRDQPEFDEVLRLGRQIRQQDLLDNPNDGMES